MANTEKVIDGCLLSIGSAYSLANIEHILGIIILIIQLLWIATKLTVKIVNAVKNKIPLELFDDDVGSVVGQINIFKDILNSDEENATSERNNNE